MMNPKNAYYQANRTDQPIWAGKLPMVLPNWLARLVWGDNTAVPEPHEPVQLTGGDPRKIAGMQDDLR
mgnify:CR=1 FL=1